MSPDEKKKLALVELAYEDYIQKVLALVQKKVAIVVNFRAEVARRKIAQLQKQIKEEQI